MKTKIAFAAALIAMASNASAASYTVTNVGSGFGYSDALFQLADGSLSSGGIVAMGYFSSAPSSNPGDIQTTISNFTILASGLTGTYSESLGGSFVGYVENFVQGNPITESSDLSFLIGQQPLYVFAGNASTLSASTQWALVIVATTFLSDDPDEQTYVAQPFGLTPIIGSIGSYTGNASGFVSESEVYTTLKLVSAVPEPTTALLGAFGVLGLLRRRRA